MSAIQLREGVWSVGVLNPALRVFDIVMESRYGTSYNAYLVTGGEKTALIEAVHKDYFEDLVSNIEEILPVEKLDYLIMNHTEPDHSGGVRAGPLPQPHRALLQLRKKIPHLHCQ